MKNDKAAFPLSVVKVSVGGKSVESVPGGTGLTRRELFAALAMQGMLSRTDEETMNATHEDVAFTAVNSADALIRELDKEDK